MHLEKIEDKCEMQYMLKGNIGKKQRSISDESETKVRFSFVFPADGAFAFHARLRTTVSAREKKSTNLYIEFEFHPLATAKKKQK